MNHWVEKFIEFVLSHNPGMIEATIAVIMVAALYLAFRSLRAAPAEEQAFGGSNLAELEKTIQKLLDKAATVPVTAAGGVAPPELLTEIDVLKKTLTERQSEITALKANLGAAPKVVNAEEKAKLEEQIQELSSKLSEYEIISEDIADLSLYKEENMKLKRELENLKAGAAAAPVAAAPIVAPPVEAPAPPPPSMPEPQVAAEPVPPPPAPAEVEAPPSLPSNLVDDDLMAEFAKAVVEQKLAALPPAPPPEPSAPLSSELERMEQEAKQMQEDPGLPEKSALDEELNTDKLQGEAEKLASAGDTPTMTDFEKFVKKG